MGWLESLCIKGDLCECRGGAAEAIIWRISIVLIYIDTYRNGHTHTCIYNHIYINAYAHIITYYARYKLCFNNYAYCISFILP